MDAGPLIQKHPEGLSFLPLSEFSARQRTAFFGRLPVDSSDQVRAEFAREFPPPVNTAGTQSSQNRKHLAVRDDRHGSQRVLKVCPTIAANFISVAFEGKNATQFRMVAAEGKIERVG